MQTHLPQSPVVSSKELDQLGPLRMLYVPAGDEVPQGLTGVPIDNWIARAKTSQTGLDDLAFWQAEFEKLGVGPDAVTVVADDGSMTEAARVWFILQYFGLPVVALNGGVTALQALPPHSAPYSGALSLTPSSGAVGLMDRAALKGALPQMQVFDARTAAEFSGLDLKGNTRGGHLPGAALLAHGDLLDEAGLKSEAEIAAMLDKAGITDGKPIVTHCNGGGRAALAALAAVMAGRSDVRVYYLSFADWAADETCPVQLQR
jgi:thiosulfate/3-mercaptopyruvate sulfurtransferase